MTLANTAQALLEQAAKQGAQADLIVERKRDFSVMVSQGAVEKQQASQAQIMGLRVIKDGRVGIAYSEATDADANQRLLNNALAAARYASPDVSQVLSTVGGDLHSPAELVQSDDWTTERKIDAALALEAQLLTSPVIDSVPSNSLGEHYIEKWVFNSQGLSARHQERVAFAYVSPIAKNQTSNAMLSQVTAGRTFNALELDRLHTDTKQAVEDLLAGQPLPSGRYDVVFSIDKLASLLAIFLSAASGKAVRDGVSPWIGKCGQSVADQRLTISDDPLNQQGLGFRSFDDEGQPTQVNSVIAQGVLQGYLHNQATAKHANAQPTGNGARSARSNASVRWHQLAVASGSDRSDQLLNHDYIEITDLAGLHSGANTISGDFSFAASGYRCRDGQRLHSVRGFTVAGNFYRMLAEHIAGIGDQQHWTSQRSALLPIIRWHNMAISG